MGINVQHNDILNPILIANGVKAWVILNNENWFKEESKTAVQVTHMTENKVTSITKLTYYRKNK